MWHILCLIHINKRYTVTNTDEFFKIHLELEPFRTKGQLLSLTQYNETAGNICIVWLSYKLSNYRYKVIFLKKKK